ncbi:MAG: acyl-CoA thioesterase [Clostridiales bacterium]|nr:acyl-CoA thioesterase [Clostridiales bacterium]
MQERQLYEHKVQYYETDQMGVVHHSNYIRWFEEARNFILEAKGCSYRQMEEMGIIVPVTAVSAEYKAMSHFLDIVCVDARLKKYNGIKMTISYVLTDKESGEVRCKGESSHCFLNPQGQLLSLKRSFPEIHQIWEQILQEDQEKDPE